MQLNRKARKDRKEGQALSSDLGPEVRESDGSLGPGDSGTLWSQGSLFALFARFAVQLHRSGELVCRAKKNPAPRKGGRVFLCDGDATYRPMAFSVWVSKACSFSITAASLSVWPTLTGVSGLTRATISPWPTVTSR
jgi:hypothetical protein